MANIQLVRLIIAASQDENAEYDPDEGAKCPVCVKLGFNPGKAPVTKTTKPKRCHKCPLCGNTFLSIEKPLNKESPKKKKKKPIPSTDSLARK